MEVHLPLHLVVAGSNISCCLSVWHFHPRRPQAKVVVELWRKGNSVVVTSYGQIFFRSRSTFVCIRDLSFSRIIFFGIRSVSSWQDFSFRWKIYFSDIFNVHLSGIHFSPGNIFQKIFLHSSRLEAAGLWARHVLALAEELFPAVIRLPNFR